MIHRARTQDGSTISYKDTKRYAWLASLTGPLVPAVAIFLYFLSGGLPVALLFPLLYSFGIVPLTDLVLGEDRDDPPAEILPRLAEDTYYRILLYTGIVLLYADFFFTAWFIGTHQIPAWAWAALTLGAGFADGTAILIGHELGHKPRRLDRSAALFINGLVGYGHFSADHNRGHHVHVATPEDHASARMGESIYRFAIREIPGALRRGWATERVRLQKKGKKACSPSNEILLSWALTFSIGVLLAGLFGWTMILFLALHHAYGWYGLTQSNYVEHYGLLRRKLADGSHGPAEACHSWNTNHRFSNIISFHLQRHSDHHSHASRPYQVLRHFPDLPRLPSGYPGCFALAAVPPLWFKVMDPKLLALAHGDLDGLNIDPHRRGMLENRYASGR